MAEYYFFRNPIDEDEALGKAFEDLINVRNIYLCLINSKQLIY